MWRKKCVAECISIVEKYSLAGLTAWRATGEYEGYLIGERRHRYEGGKETMFDGPKLEEF